MTAILERQIVKLSDIMISRIAAGEVVDRPASVVKELVENSLDAGASDIVIKIENGGKDLISVSDDGCGMDSANLFMAVDSHTTSKLASDDLINIRQLGFRGEAIASIGAVSHLTIKSRPAHLPDGASISVNGGVKTKVTPCPHHVGTTVEIRDLFYATPARLKFLRTDKTENQHIESIINKIAIAYPKVSFKFYIDGKQVLNYMSSDLLDARGSRIAEVLGKEFFDNAIALDQSIDGSNISGYACLPTYTRSSYTDQYLYVNNRAVRDKLLLIYIKEAYKDFIGHDKHPKTVLFLNVPAELVDVNVHPSKTEVRFRDVFFIKNLVIGTLKRALGENSTRISSTIGTAALGIMSQTIEPVVRRPEAFAPVHTFQPAPARHQFYEPVRQFNAPVQFEEEAQLLPLSSMFGTAKAQLHQTYIVAQTHDGMVIVDQHAAHERICYEKFKSQVQAGHVESQRLLVPEVVELDNVDLQDKMLKLGDGLMRVGLKIEYHSEKSIKVTEVPSLLNGCDIRELVHQITNSVADLEDGSNVEVLINKVLSTYACHFSIRAGREMMPEEMNRLLREMEATQKIGQCNHGRPTYIELKLKDIKKLFERS